MQSGRYPLLSLFAVVCAFRDLCNASVSVLGDCFSVAVVQQLSRKDLDKMDEQCEEDTVRGYSERI